MNSYLYLAGLLLLLLSFKASETPYAQFTNDGNTTSLQGSNVTTALEMILNQNTTITDTPEVIYICVPDALYNQSYRCEPFVNCNGNLVLGFSCEEDNLDNSAP